MNIEEIDKEQARISLLERRLARVEQEISARLNLLGLVAAENLASLLVDRTSDEKLRRALMKRLQETRVVQESEPDTHDPYDRAISSLVGVAREIRDLTDRANRSGRK